MKLPLVLISIGALLAACAAAATPSAQPSAPRTIQVTMTDEFRYEPAELSVAAGETVVFEVHNGGQLVHEFVIGDEEEQEHHAEEMGAMASGMEMHDEPNVISVDPGQTKTLEYTFGEPGELLIGCHEPGHYEAGMIATITVE